MLDEKTTSAEKSRTRIEPIARYDSKGTRFTCVALADGFDDVGSGDANMVSEEENCHSSWGRG